MNELIVETDNVIHLAMEIIHSTDERGTERRKRILNFSSSIQSLYIGIEEKDVQLYNEMRNYGKIW